MQTFFEAVSQRTVPSKLDTRGLYPKYCHPRRMIGEQRRIHPCRGPNSIQNDCTSLQFDCDSNSYRDFHGTRRDRAHFESDNSSTPDPGASHLPDVANNWLGMLLSCNLSDDELR